jgi:hypothetical protein
MPQRFASRVAGIPCLIEITHYAPGTAAYQRGHPDEWMPEEPAELEFQVCDQRGRLAPWLQRKLTAVDEDRITEQAYRKVAGL